jgi:hypothetical protein
VVLSPVSNRASPSPVALKSSCASANDIGLINGTTELTEVHCYDPKEDLIGMLTEPAHCGLCIMWVGVECDLIDDLFNLSRFYDIFLFFVTDVHRWILKPKPSRRFVKLVAIRPTTPRRLSRFVTICKKIATSLPHEHLGPPHCHASATSPPRHALLI